MVRNVILIGAALFAAPANAGTVLWDKVEADMPFARAKELYPNAHIRTGKGLARPMLTIDKQKIGECQADIWILIDRKVAEPDAKVEGVRISGFGCDSRMFNSLLARYGEPADVNNDNRDRKKTSRWVADGKTIVFRRESGSWGDSWEINYAPVKDLGL